MEFLHTVNKINGLIDVDRAASAIGIHARSIRKLGQPDDGKTSPIQRFSEWAQFVTSQHDPEVNNAMIEILKPILDNMEMAIVNGRTLGDLRRLLAQVAPDDTRLDESKSTTICPRCADPLEPMPVAGGWYCRGCGRE